MRRGAAPAWPQLAAGLAWGGLLAALLALGVLWHRDRTRQWETPRWDAGRFVLLADRDSDAGELKETWVVAVHPACPHCQVSLREVVSAREREGSPIRVAGLIVDVVRPPASATVAALPGDRIWWDARGVWRERWGHRVYGEVLCFDPAGGYLRCLSPLVEADVAPGSAPALGR
ncbi:MAG: hypothetical protein A2W00_10165 [Candidatus Eisenbacteria bacterium RBG_16_71_46]|nr:MAG: hypothetical protein A2W00_10165 [Candidatus Eisenbacteria bacterium RBG_16_71_46]